MRTISFEQGEAAMDWMGLVDAFKAGHKRPKASVEDLFLYRGKRPQHRVS